MSDRILKVGGPLEGWRRAAVRRNKDVADEISQILDVGLLEEVLSSFSGRLEKRFKAWGPAQYIANLPEGISPFLQVSPSFEGGVVSICTKVAHPGRLAALGPINEHYRWTKKGSYVYNESNILRYLLILIRQQPGFHISYVCLGRNEHNLTYSITVRTPGTGSWFSEGEISPQDVFDYSKVLASVTKQDAEAVIL